MTMGGQVPRVVVVTRSTELDLLIATHATREQAAFFLRGRGQKLEAVEKAHLKQQVAVKAVLDAVPVKWRRNSVPRQDLDRFLFEPEDIVVVVGQDGLVANVAKYLDGQKVIGINPDPAHYDGILVPHPAKAIQPLLLSVSTKGAATQDRTMVAARLDDGQTLVALNEVFVGHRTHQSARYRLKLGKMEELQSSSGLIVATGTGATGWAHSINLQREGKIALPGPGERKLVFFVREAFPSVSSGTSLTGGLLEGGARLKAISEMNDGGVIFGDGIENDRLEFKWGMAVEVGLAPKKLRLVMG
jgi:NAD kinase